MGNGLFQGGGGDFEALRAFVSLQARGLDSITRADRTVAGLGRTARGTQPRLDALGGSTARMAGAFRDANGRLQDARGRFIGAGQGADTLNRSIGLLVVSTLRFRDIIAGGFIGSLGARAFRTLTRAAVGTVQSGIRLATTYEQAQIRLERFTGSARITQRVLDDLQAFGARTDFNFLRDLVPAAQQLLSSQLSTPETLIRDLRQLGDIRAGSTNADLNRIVLNLGQIQANGRAATRDLREFANNGIPIFQLLRETLGVTGEELDDLVQDGAIGIEEVRSAFNRLTGEGGRFFGLLEASSQSTAGLLSNLEDNVDDLSRKLGGELLPIINDVAQAINQAFDDGAFDIFIERAGEAAEVLRGVLDTLSAPDEEQARIEAIDRRLEALRARQRGNDGLGILGDLFNVTVNQSIEELERERQLLERVIAQGRQVRAQADPPPFAAAPPIPATLERERTPNFIRQGPSFNQFREVTRQREEAERLGRSLLSSDERRLERIRDALRLSEELLDTDRERALVLRQQAQNALANFEPSGGRGSTSNDRAQVATAIQASSNEFIRLIAQQQQQDATARAVRRNTEQVVAKLEELRQQAEEAAGDGEPDELNVIVQQDGCQVQAT